MQKKSIQSAAVDNFFAVRPVHQVAYAEAEGKNRPQFVCGDFCL